MTIFSSHLFGLAIVAVIFTGSIFVHVLVPAKLVVGYCCDNANLKPLHYRLNGVLSLLVVLGIFCSLSNEWKRIIYDNFYVALSGANIIGLTLSSILFLVGGKEKYMRCVTTDQLGDTKNIKIDNAVISAPLRFFLGSLWNPRYFGIDLKMVLYLIGAITLQLVIVSAVFVHLEHNNFHMSNAMVVYSSCFSWFLFEYLHFEHVHLFTYDLFAEKVGFKLAWGCLVFYPFFYPIGIHSLVYATASVDIHGASQIAVDLSPQVCALIAALFLVGWSITRGANMQKYYFRTQPETKTFLFGLVEQRTVGTTHILCSGWWGAARHFNYCGEIVQGVALALPGFLVGSSVFYKVIPLLYPLYYIGLFVSRQMDDDVVCRRKYGDAVWDEYCQKVPYRIVPGVW